MCCFTEDQSDRTGVHLFERNRTRHQSSVHQSSVGERHEQHTLDHTAGEHTRFGRITPPGPCSAVVDASPWRVAGRDLGHVTRCGRRGAGDGAPRGAQLRTAAPRRRCRCLRSTHRCHARARRAVGWGVGVAGVSRCSSFGRLRSRHGGSRRAAGRHPVVDCEHVSRRRRPRSVHRGTHRPERWRRDPGGSGHLAAVTCPVIALCRRRDDAGTGSRARRHAHRGAMCQVDGRHRNYGGAREVPGLSR